MKTITLLSAKLNQVYVVESIVGLPGSVKRRLLQFGIIKNARIIVENRAWGSSTQIISVMGSKIAIDSKIAGGIMVYYV